MLDAQFNTASLTEADARALVQRLLTGDAEAFEVLFKHYHAKVYGQAIRLLGNDAEAEEVLQEVFLTVYEKAHTFRGEAAFSTWLYRLTANAALGRLRRRRRHPERSLDDFMPTFQEDGHHRVRPVVDWSQDLENQLAEAEARRLLREAIDDLPPIDKAVVVFSEFDELSNQEIGDILGLSVSAVKARLHRARLYLRGRLSVLFSHASLEGNRLS
jgi:RNA polymerase sigma-70 factor (ECF subfamily)